MIDLAGWSLLFRLCILLQVLHEVHHEEAQLTQAFTEEILFRYVGGDLLTLQLDDGMEPIWEEGCQSLHIEHLEVLVGVQQRDQLPCMLQQGHHIDQRFVLHVTEHLLGHVHQHVTHRGIGGVEVLQEGDHLIQLGFITTTTREWNTYSTSWVACTHNWCCCVWYAPRSTCLASSWTTRRSSTASHPVTYPSSQDLCNVIIICVHDRNSDML